MSNTNFNYIYKVIMVGDSQVGKTNIVSRLATNMFLENSKSTIGIDFQTACFGLNNGGPIIKLQIWDTAGQEKFRSIIRNYYKLSASVLIVFDLSNHNSFINVEKWLKEIQDNIECDLGDMVLLLIGNKSDLERKVEDKDINNICNKYNLTYVETSAKNNTNIHSAFHNLVAKVHKKGRHIHFNDNYNEVINLNNDNSTTGCCVIL